MLTRGYFPMIQSSKELHAEYIIIASVLLGFTDHT